MALALAQSDTGLIRIQEFLTTNDTDALEFAETNSITGLHFFTELGLDAPDLPFFMPGLVKAERPESLCLLRNRQPFEFPPSSRAISRP